jgi:hypothetical protein
MGDNLQRSRRLPVRRGDSRAGVQLKHRYGHYVKLFLNIRIEFAQHKIITSAASDAGLKTGSIHGFNITLHDGTFT